MEQGFFARLAQARVRCARVSFSNLRKTFSRFGGATSCSHGGKNIFDQMPF
jgi:hypothetical protein